MPLLRRHGPLPQLTPFPVLWVGLGPGWALDSCWDHRWEAVGMQGQTKERGAEGLPRACFPGASRGEERG